MRFIVRVRLYVINIELFKRVVIGTEYCDDAGILSSAPVITIEGEDYSKWASDDNYIVNYVYQRLGITPFVPEPVIIPVPEPVLVTDTEPVPEP